MLLNCDLGESFGNYGLGMDSDVMPHIDQANVACGFHAGDPVVLDRTLKLAAEHGVAVGAHPSYPDLVGFGRRSMQLSEAEIIATVRYQAAAVDGVAACHGVTVGYVKPHGALYNDMMADKAVRSAIMQAVASYHRPLALMMQATPDAGVHQTEARAFGLELQFEAFADRRYTDDGRLQSRRLPGAVLDRDAMLAQVEQLCADGTVQTSGGKTLSLTVDTLCVHGDNAEGVEAIAAIRALVDRARER